MACCSRSAADWPEAAEQAIYATKLKVCQDLSSAVSAASGSCCLVAAAGVLREVAIADTSNPNSSSADFISVLEATAPCSTVTTKVTKFGEIQLMWRINNFCSACIEFAGSQSYGCRPDPAIYVTFAVYFDRSLNQHSMAP